MRRFNLFLCNILIIYTIISSTFAKHHRRKLHRDDDDPGEALNLADYIESGNIKEVISIEIKLQ